MSNPIPPSVTPPSPNEWPQSIQAITGITRGLNTTVTVPNHGFTSQDEGQTSLMFQQVVGMRQINGVPGRIVEVVDTNNFTVDVNSISFYPYVSGGIINQMTGRPPIQLESFQYVNTPFQNIA